MNGHRIKNKRKRIDKIVTTISIEVPLMQEVDKICEKEDITRSYFYNSLLKLYFGTNE